MESTLINHTEKISPSGKQEAVLQVENLCVHYGSFQAVKQVCCNVYGGEIFGLLGPNGAGKTSTLQAIEGLIKPAAGTIIVNGYSLKEKPLHARANIGVQLQSTSFQHELTINEILQLYAGLYDVVLTKIKLESILNDINLREGAQRRFGQLSLGQQQRVSLAIAMLHQPSLLLLDEPTSGLDPQSRRQLWQQIERLRSRQHAIVLTTHSMEEAEAVCDRIAIINHGEIVALDSPQSIIDEYANNPEVMRASRRGKITLEDVFIGLTGSTIRS